MSLWGIHKAITGTGTIAISATGTVTGSGTAFTTQAKVGDYIHTNDGSDFLILSIASDTSATVINGTVNGKNPGDANEVTAIGAGASFTLSEKPKYVTTAESNIPSGVSGDSTKVIGVSASNNIGAPAHAGWVRSIAQSGGRSGRTITEVLVANGRVVN